MPVTKTDTSKPFLLPQKDPTHYDTLVKTYTVPELITGPVEVSNRSLGHATRSEENRVIDMPITGATKRAEDLTLWQEVRE